MVNAMCDLTVGIFEHLHIMSKTGVDKRVKYTDHILKGASLNKYRAILLVCKEMKNIFIVIQ